ncbi:hypothetical protein, partial [Brucella pseudogrignonensis]|uniref:hypothetical protein n=1 Tax=Brucella pseudogrignonensis TaxID=419475 RepID=UPI00286B67AD
MISADANGIIRPVCGSFWSCAIGFASAYISGRSGKPVKQGKLSKKIQKMNEYALTVLVVGVYMAFNEGGDAASGRLLRPCSSSD